ncbi:hypothetical protein [Paenibacillus massiliensis]|uniref:hypothetical protein n=1 Tax=Paenibacillus massiliensis TaxID=225917 RepID=UPI00046FDBF9|nr:hypothetical protein [Paenibacillus massiliensis]
MTQRICIVLGPYDEKDLEYAVTLGYLVHEHYAVYVTDSYLWLRKVLKATQHSYLYLDDLHSAGLVLATDITQPTSSCVEEIILKLRHMNALDFLIGEHCNLSSGDIFLSINKTFG